MSDRVNTPGLPVADVQRRLDGGFAESTEALDPINHLGPALVYGLFSASRTIQIHDLKNRASQTGLSRLIQTLEELIASEGRVTLAVSSDLLSINDVRVVVDSQSVGPVLYLIAEMKKKRVEELDFLLGVTADEMGTFLKLFSEDSPTDDVFGDLSKRMAEAGITNIRLTEWIERERYLRDSRIERREIREESNKAMSRAIRFMGEVMKAIEQQRPIQIPKAHRLTQQLADIIQVDETILVGLASIKDYDEYTFSHSVNVSVLSMLIADRMGIEKQVTAQIGVAALLHDIGKTHVPLSILNKPSGLTADEWALMERHTMLGVIEMSRVRSLRAVIDPMFVSLQHHLLFNFDGYPRKHGVWDTHPYTPMVTVADVFDAMTTPRVYRQCTLTPDRVLRFILHKGGEMFDPLVVKAFIKAIGIYPVGTVVELNSGENAVVVRQNDGPRMLHRPVVALLGKDGAQGDLVDLAERAASTAIHRRSIVRAVHNRQMEAAKASCFVVS
jgi:putative nucleotidyltransferase with HDIG domain